MNRISNDDIINSYLKLLARSPWNDISLNDVASDLGVSKSSLFRHYPSKQALLIALMNRVYADFGELRIHLAAAETYREKMVIGLRFILERRSSFPFYVQVFVSHHLQGFNNFKNCDAFMAIPEEMRYRSLVYIGVSIHAVASGKVTDEEGIQTLADKLLLLFENGIGGEVPTYGLVLGDEPELKRDRYVTAMDDVIRTYGLQSFSMKRFAESLGLAPSTLYSSFASKDELLLKVATDEHVRFFKFLDRHLQDVTTPQEALVALYTCILFYLGKKPEITTYTNGFLWMWKSDESFASTPSLTHWTAELEKMDKGLGHLAITLPLVHTMEKNASHISEEDVLRLLFHGCTKKEA
jgi:AcrR family transcriptional regulator